MATSAEAELQLWEENFGSLPAGRSP